MQVLLTDLLQFRTEIDPIHNQGMTHKTIRQSMMMRPTCLCCSNTLLRHARSREIYWRCSHCYQEMPASNVINKAEFPLLLR
jgi:ribosomal protein L37AE/L43A